MGPYWCALGATIGSKRGIGRAGRELAGGGRRKRPRRETFKYRGGRSLGEQASSELDLLQRQVGGVVK